MMSISCVGKGLKGERREVRGRRSEDRLRLRLSSRGRNVGGGRVEGMEIEVGS
jgi:hypothetical protein